MNFPTKISPEKGKGKARIRHGGKSWSQAADSAHMPSNSARSLLHSNSVRVPPKNDVDLSDARRETTPPVPVLPGSNTDERIPQPTVRNASPPNDSVSLSTSTQPTSPPCAEVLAPPDLGLELPHIRASHSRRSPSPRPADLPTADLDMVDMDDYDGDDESGRSEMEGWPANEDQEVSPCRHHEPSCPIHSLHRLGGTGLLQRLTRIQTECIWTTTSVTTKAAKTVRMMATALTKQT